MLIKIRKASDVRASEITPKSVFLDRRRFLCAAAVAGAGVAMAPLALAGSARAGDKLTGVVKGPYSTDEEQTKYEAVTSYNNFYEFGSGKGDPARYSRDFKTKPWSVAVEGAVAKPAVYGFEDLIRPHKLEERVYRLRCV